MKRSLILLLCLFSKTLLSQDYPRKEINLEKLVDEVFPVQDLDLNYQELYENLAQLLSNPVDLNAITREQLRALFILSEAEVNEFLKFRDESDPLLSVYELQSIPGWDKQTFERIIPFVRVIDPQSKLNSGFLKRVASEENNYLVMRYERTLEEKRGYRPDADSSQRYAGSPDELYLRYRVARSNDFSFGITAEKDAGEVNQWSPAKKQYGPDYLSFHAQVMNKGRLRNLIAGDFQSQFGQGLTLGSVFGFGKNAETITTVRRSNLGFLPYTSLNENLYFRGLAVSYQLHSYITLHAFASRTARDGRVLATESVDDPSFISSFNLTGLHRTPAEIMARDQIEETNTGAVLQFRKSTLDAGLIFHQTQFDKPVQRQSTPYNQFSFQGSMNQNVGAYVNYNIQNFTFFGEASQTIGHGPALTAGVLGSLTNKAEVSFLYRNFARDFYSFYSNAFAESTVPQNERGFYWGWKYTFNKRYWISGYVDLFKFPWLRYRGYAPSEGNEWLIRFNYNPSKTVLLFLQMREETKIRNQSGETNLYYTALGTKRNYWINLDYQAPPYFTFKTRAQFSSYDLAGRSTRGVALIQDVNFDIKRWSFSFRYALFDTDDYDNRLYVYERDVWLAFSFPALYGVGIRNYAMVQYRVSKKVDLWLRWARTRFTDRDQIGTAGELIDGNTRNDLKFQARIRF
ncbi:MAG: helix-hairpin-helix domain-containing protein [Cyclobacteriaceae bacterium]|nr:helix-hairpin-helix domain-containing protein [Cyclobacteriaceae bacterium]